MCYLKMSFQLWNLVLLYELSSNPHSQYEKSSGPVDRLATEELEAYLNVRNESIDY